MTALRNAGPLKRTLRVAIPVYHRDDVEMITQHAGGTQAGHASTNDNSASLGHAILLFFRSLHGKTVEDNVEGLLNGFSKIESSFAPHPFGDYGEVRGDNNAGGQAWLDIG